MLRIGVWFDVTHCSYGGPTLVLLGGIKGLLKDAETTGRPITILLNEPGDVNWIVGYLEDYKLIVNSLKNPLIGPLCFSHTDALCEDYTTHRLWKAGKNFIIASEWFKTLIQVALPFNNPVEAASSWERKLTVWGSGVDTEFYTPSLDKTQDYFIYFKTQKYASLSNIHVYFFNNYFKLSGSLLAYYHYNATMLKEAAQKSRFCIFMSASETQCLAALEIMACDIPLLVIDTTSYTIEDITVDATSVTCWDERCGMKTTLERFDKDFPTFYENLEKYRPREFVLENYSFEAAGHNLRKLLQGLNGK
jgi:hypothetical protein